MNLNEKAQELEDAAVSLLDDVIEQLQHQRKNIHRRNSQVFIEEQLKALAWVTQQLTARNVLRDLEEKSK